MREHGERKENSREVMRGVRVKNGPDFEATRIEDGYLNDADAVLTERIRTVLNTCIHLGHCSRHNAFLGGSSAKSLKGFERIAAQAREESERIRKEFF
ncbi:hypothetical protein KM043_010310 [Ampulex compressa]|nr:hypothetical protein KM043_010310 [Ampulex compressa]